VVHTSIRRFVPPTNPCTRCKFGMNRRLVFTLEWLTENPLAGRFPQMSHTLAMLNPSTSNRTQTLVTV